MAILCAISLLVGVVTGLRSLTGVAALALATYLDVFVLHGNWLAWFHSIVTVVVLLVLAFAEYVNDLLPSAASRLALSGLLPRLITGAFCGVILSTVLTSNMLGLIAGALCGLLGAGLGAQAGFRIRMRLIALTQNRVVAGLIEDAITIILAVITVYAVAAA